MSDTAHRMVRPTPRFLTTADMWSLAEALRPAGPPLLFGLRLWASVSLALYAAFWLQLDNPFWAGASAAIVCQPQLGASLRKGWFRMLGTLVGAIMSVVLVACFAQDRLLFLGGLALWAAVCAFFATLLRNFASYAASLAGYTAAIIAGDLLGTVGGIDANAAFLLAVSRATAICLGIACAGVVLAGTDLGGARRRLAAAFAELAGGITSGLVGTLAAAVKEPRETQAVQRDFLRRAIAFDPVVDQALGKSSQVRYHSPVLRRAVDGLVLCPGRLVRGRGPPSPVARQRGGSRGRRPFRKCAAGITNGFGARRDRAVADGLDRPVQNLRDCGCAVRVSARRDFPPCNCSLTKWGTHSPAWRMRSTGLPCSLAILHEPIQVASASIFACPTGCLL